MTSSFIECHRWMKKIGFSSVSLLVYIATLILTYRIGNSRRKLANQIYSPSTFEKSRQQLSELQSLLVQEDSFHQQITPSIYLKNGDKPFYYNHTSSMVFIGGVPRSGTTLMRAILDTHSQIHCGQETHLIPKMLNWKTKSTKSKIESKRLSEAGITPLVWDESMKKFILEIMVRHQIPANILCNKDPFTLSHSLYLKHLYPKAKFILCVRDGRAVTHSLIERKINITKWDMTSYKDVLKHWNQSIMSMHYQCEKLGINCKIVKYEDLILHPKKTLKDLTEFLDVEFEDQIPELLK